MNYLGKLTSWWRALLANWPSGSPPGSQPEGLTKLPTSLFARKTALQDFWVSVNETVVHGIPSGYVLRDGDIVSIDCGAVTKAGFNGDSCYTFCVGEVSEEVKKLLRTTKESLYEGIKQAIPGNRIGDIGHAVQEYCEKRGYSVVREMCGHGVGHKLHEDPDVPNYGRRGTGPLIKNGMTIAIEPMINMGSKNIVIERDGWTTRTKDRKPSAHFEHSIAIHNGKPDILSSFKYVEEVLGDRFI